MKIHWSAIAEADLDDIHDYIARDVPYYAELFIDRLIKTTDKLEEYPRMGRKVPEADHRDEVRELIIQGYRDYWGQIQISDLFVPDPNYKASSKINRV